MDVNPNEAPKAPPTKMAAGQPNVEFWWETTIIGLRVGEWIVLVIIAAILYFLLQPMFQPIRE